MGSEELPSLGGRAGLSEPSPIPAPVQGSTSGLEPCPQPALASLPFPILEHGHAAAPGLRELEALMPTRCRNAPRNVGVTGRWPPFSPPRGLNFHHSPLYLSLSFPFFTPAPQPAICMGSCKKKVHVFFSSCLAHYIFLTSFTQHHILKTHPCCWSLVGTLHIYLPT